MARSDSNYGSSVNRSVIVSELKDRFQTLPHKVVNVGVKTILDAMSNALRYENHIELRGFGSFSVTKRKERMAYNPRTGEKVYVKGKNVPHFKPGKHLRAVVNNRSDDK